MKKIAVVRLKNYVAWSQFCLFFLQVSLSLQLSQGLRADFLCVMAR